MDLVIASKNLHKIRELRSMLKAAEIRDVLSLLDFPDYTPPEEIGSSFEENATLKATHAAKALDKLVLADDSGLIVPALNGRPGINSSRFASENATDRENRKKLLSEMAFIKGDARAAYFECCLVLAFPDGLEKIVHGFCEGTILENEQGNHGFGYDSLFMKNDYNKSFAQISEEMKNKISHRFKAVEKLLPYLETLAS